MFLYSGIISFNFIVFLRDLMSFCGAEDDDEISSKASQNDIKTLRKTIELKDNNRNTISSIHIVKTSCH